MRMRARTPAHLAIPLVVALALGSALIAAAPPEDESAVDRTRLSAIRPLIEAAIADRKLPGAVVLVGDRRGVVYTDAVGQRALMPAREPMTTDTIFDLASLTKVVSTTTIAMLLIEEGRLGLDDPVTSYFPAFGRYGKQRISIRHLLTHTSGLRPDLDLAVEFEGRDTAIQKAIEEVPVAAPGDRFIYSDLNFVLLGGVIARVTGEPLERVAASRVFGPLGMRDTGYLPSSALAPRIAPTESCTPLGWPCRPGPGATMLRGVVHDPTARRMGGVAGHAGVFGHCRRPLAVLPDARERRLARRPAIPLATECGADDACRDAERSRAGPRPGVGHRFAVLRPTAVTCFLSDPSATRDGRARPLWIDRALASTSSSCRIGCIRMGKAT